MLLAVPALSLAAAPAGKGRRPAAATRSAPAAKPPAARPAPPQVTPARPLLRMDTRIAAPPAGIDVCYNYGCAALGRVAFTGAQLGELRALLGKAANAERERAVLAQAVGRMYAWAAGQAPIGADKAGNYADGGMPGAMDCIDHSTTTTRFLRLLESRGWLRFHRVREPVRRINLIFEHFSAAIMDLGDGASVVRTDEKARTWAVDSWYVDNGKPPLIAQLDEWERMNDPD